MPSELIERAEQTHPQVSSSPVMNMILAMCSAWYSGRSVDCFRCRLWLEISNVSTPRWYPEELGNTLKLMLEWKSTYGLTLNLATPLGDPLSLSHPCCRQEATRCSAMKLAASVVVPPRNIRVLASLLQAGVFYCSVNESSLPVLALSERGQW